MQLSGVQPAPGRPEAVSLSSQAPTARSSWPEQQTIRTVLPIPPPHTHYSHHPPSRSRVHIPPQQPLPLSPNAHCLSPPGNPPRRPHFRCYPGPSLVLELVLRHSCSVSQSDYEEVLGIRLLLLFVKLRCDLAWHTSNRAACRTALVAQGSTMGLKGQSTRCKVSFPRWTQSR